MSLDSMRQQAIDEVNAVNAARRAPNPNDVIPSIPSSTGVVTEASGATQTVADAYLAALASQTKNTAGDTAPYVVIPNQAATDGGGISIVTVGIVAALGLAAWWFIKKRGAA